MKIIGVTGLTGSGKTELSRVLGRLGAYVIDADAMAHEVLRKGGAAYGDVLAFFGDGILGDDGEIVRRKLGAVVFNDAEKLGRLNEITHEHILRGIYGRIAEARKNPECKAVVLDVILLAESGLSEVCDVVVAVCSDERTRIMRIMKRDGITPEEAMSRVGSQVSCKDATNVADYVLENNGGFAEFAEKAGELAARLLEA